MKVDLMNIDKFVAANGCQQVTSPIFFNYTGNPAEGGLFSYDLFGVTDEERKNRFGYIDLHTHYLHPMVYSILSRLGSVKDIINGNKYAIIEEHKIKIVPEDTTDAETGIDFLYKKFDEINWLTAIEDGEMHSIDKKTRLKFLRSLDKNEFFITKWLVLPPFYREENSQDKSMGDSINKLYKNLISKTNSMRLGHSISLFGDQTKVGIQKTLLDIYQSSMAPISGKNLLINDNGGTTLTGSGKNSMIRKHLMGKSMDYCCCNVITSPQDSSAKSPADLPAPFGYGLFPMATLLSLFNPFFSAEVVDYMKSVITDFKYEFNDDIEKINIGQYSNDDASKMIKRFIESESSRFDPVTIEYIDKEGEKVERSFYIYEYASKQDVANKKIMTKREFTQTDLFYILAMDILKDKHAYITRYPIANFQNIYPTKIKVNSTATVRDIYISIDPNNTIQTAIHYERYPTVEYPGGNINKIDSGFYNVMICGNTPLKSLGGDYDGDTLYLRGVFTKEANDEAERLCFAKSNMLNASGGPSRGLAKIGKEAVMGLYEFTKNEHYSN